MQTNVHRTNSDFALQHFLAGSCSTPDGAWALLYGQSLALKSNIAHGDTHALRVKAKEVKLASTQSQSSEYYEALAELLEVQANEEIMQNNISGAKEELATVYSLMAELEPQCKYKDFSVRERLELCRQEEWLGELKRRGENMMLSNVLGISYDHIETMRQHPEFASEILPHLMTTYQTIRTNINDPKKLMASFIKQPGFNMEFINKTSTLELEK